MRTALLFCAIALAAARALLNLRQHRKSPERSGWAIFVLMLAVAALYIETHPNASWTLLGSPRVIWTTLAVALLLGTVLLSSVIRDLKDLYRSVKELQRRVPPPAPPAPPPSQPGLLRVYEFSLRLGSRFLRDVVQVTELELTHAADRFPTHGQWPAVTVTIEEWSTHVVFKVAPPLHPPQTKHTVYAPGPLQFLRGPYELWRNSLSPADDGSRGLPQHETLLLHFRRGAFELLACGGRFGEAWERREENLHLRIPCCGKELAARQRSEEWLQPWHAEYGLDSPERGVSWNLKIIDLEVYLARAQDRETEAPAPPQKLEPEPAPAPAQHS